MEPPPDENAPALDGHTCSALLGVAALGELIAASVVCSDGYCGGWNGFAVAVGAVSLAFLAPIYVLLFFESLAPPQLQEYLPHLSVFQLLWWIPSAFFLTLISPFTTLGNGYFLCLGAVAASVLLCRAQVPPFETAVATFIAGARAAPSSRIALVLLAATSTLVWVGAAISIGRTPVAEHTGTKVWSIIVGIVSMMMCSSFLLMQPPDDKQHSFAMLLAAWWLQGAALSFVPNLFIGTVNGYFGTWASVLLAAYFLRCTHDLRDLQPVPSAPLDEDGLGGPTTAYMYGGSGSGAAGSGGMGMGGGMGGTWSEGGASSPVQMATIGSPAPSSFAIGTPVSGLSSPPPADFRHTGEGDEK